MDEMNVHAVDGRDELVKLIESLLGGAPVVFLPPVRDEALSSRRGSSRNPSPSR